MANSNADDLITTIRLRAARQSDSVLITRAFVLAGLNEAQIQILRKTPRLKPFDKTDTSTYQLSTNDVSFNLATINPAHLGGIWILNGASTRREGLKYRRVEEFRKKFLPVANQGATEPVEYTRQADVIYFNCPVSSDLNNLYLHIDYTDWATALTDAATASEIVDSDKGLIFFALAEIYDEIALSQPKFEQKALKTRVLFNNWLETYQDYNEMMFEELYEE